MDTTNAHDRRPAENCSCILNTALPGPYLYLDVPLYLSVTFIFNIIEAQVFVYSQGALFVRDLPA